MESNRLSGACLFRSTLSYNTAPWGGPAAAREGFGKLRSIQALARPSLDLIAA